MYSISNIHPISADVFHEMKRKDRREYLKILIKDLFIPAKAIYKNMLGQSSYLAPVRWYGYEDGIVMGEYVANTELVSFGRVLQDISDDPTVINLKRMFKHPGMLESRIENHIRFMKELGMDPMLNHPYGGSIDEIYDLFGIKGYERLTTDQYLIGITKLLQDFYRQADEGDESDDLGRKIVNLELLIGLTYKHA